MEDLEAHLDTLYEAAKRARSDDRYAAAAELLGPYLHHRTRHGWAWYAFGDSLRRLGLRLEAERALLRAIDLLKRPDWPTIRLAQLHEALGDPDEAERWFGRAVGSAYGQEHGWVWILRGANLARTNHFELALSCHRRALTLPDTDYDEAHLNIGLILRAKGEYGESAAAIRRALEITPDYPHAVEALGSLDGIAEAVRLALATPTPDTRD